MRLQHLQLPEVQGPQIALLPSADFQHPIEILIND
jgi:hypothetical protein